MRSLKSKDRQTSRSCSHFSTIIGKCGKFIGNSPGIRLLRFLFVMVMAVSLPAASGPRGDARLVVKEQAARENANVQLKPTFFARPQRKQERAAKYPKLVQRLEPRLIDAWEQAATGGVQRSVAALSASGVRMQGENVIVIVECAQTADPKDVAALIVAKNGIVVRTGESHVKAAVPISALDEIANMPGVTFVRVPIQKRVMNTVKTEGRGVTGAANWHAAGLTGKGAKVAVIDVDFAGLTALKAQDEIPASAIEMDFSGTGMTSGTDGHGCACAEIVYDMAPGCQLYLIKALDPSDDEAAKNYCKTQGVHIISYSTGYDALNFHDGVAYNSISPHPVTIINDAAGSGILWVNSAGNEQLQHAMVAWQDNDADDNLDWTPSPSYRPLNELWNGGRVIPAGEVIDVYLTWNEWPVTDQDFDIDLYRFDGSTWTYIVSAENYQTGTNPPFEHLRHTVTNAARYAVAIWKYNATRSPMFILRSYPYELFYYGYDNYITPSAGSVCIPADAASSFSVGAIRYTAYTNGPIEWFSSLGPNNGAYTGNPTVVKPDICGPDFVSTVTYGAEGFGGTSSSAPHIAGLAALVKGLYPAYTNTQLRSYIERSGVDLGTAGKDNTYGYGPCVLPRPVFVSIAQLWPNVVVRGTNGMPGRTNYLMVTTNAALPLSEWMRQATNVFDANGSFSFTNVVDPAVPRFFMLQLP